MDRILYERIEKGASYGPTLLVQVQWDVDQVVALLQLDGFPVALRRVGEALRVLTADDRRAAELVALSQEEADASMRPEQSMLSPGQILCLLRKRKKKD